MVFLAYVLYHFISKGRGNEKNVKMNNFGLALAMLMLVKYSVVFTDNYTYIYIYDQWETFLIRHAFAYNWI